MSNSENRRKSDDLTFKLVMTALMTAMVTLCTMIQIPTPVTGGYIHPGDTAIFLAVLVLGKKYGALASGVGSALTDLFSGYGHYVPWTLVIKGAMALIMGLFIEAMMRKNRAKLKLFNVPVIEIVGMVLAGIFMSLGYAVAAAVMYGNVVTGISGIPLNMVQFAFGMVVATVVAQMLYATPARKYFAFRLDRAEADGDAWRREAKD